MTQNYDSTTISKICLQAVEENRSISILSHEWGIPASFIYRRVRAYRRHEVESRKSSGEKILTEEEYKNRMREHEKKEKKLRQENEILKAFGAYISDKGG